MRGEGGERRGELLSPLIHSRVVNSHYDTMREPNLYGYYKISEECFLVKCEGKKGRRRFLMFKYICYLLSTVYCLLLD